MADIVISDLPAKTSLLDSDMVVIDDGAQSYRVSGAQLREFLKVNFLPIGTVVYSQSNLASDNAGRLPLFTGETIASADTLYPDFYAWVLSHTELQITAEAYEAALSTYGECPKYVIDTVNKTIRLPKLTSHIKMANVEQGITQYEGVTGNDFKHYHVFGYNSGNNSGNFVASKINVAGTIPTVDSDTGLRGWNGSGGGGGFSSYSQPYGGNMITTYNTSDLPSCETAYTTVFPWVCAYNAAIPASVAQAAEFQNALSGKADVNLGNLSDAGQIVSAKMSMPSDTRESVVLGVSGTSYTAPADGYFNFRGMATVNGQFAYIGDSTYNLCAFQMDAYANNYVVFTLPVKKGQTIIINYNLGANLALNFIYAEGAKTEAN